MTWFTNNYSLAKICYANGNTVTSAGSTGYAGVLAGRIGGKGTDGNSETATNSDGRMNHNLYHNTVSGSIPPANYLKGGDISPTVYSTPTHNAAIAFANPTVVIPSFDSSDRSFKTWLEWNLGYNRYYYDESGTETRGAVHTSFSMTAQTFGSKWGGTVSQAKTDYQCFPLSPQYVLATDTVSVTFNYNDIGGKGTEVVGIRKGERVWAPGALPNTVGQHIKWVKDIVGQPDAVFGERVITDTTFKAVSTPVTYTVAYNKNASSDATVSGTMSNSAHTYGVSKGITHNAYVSTKYEFRGWTDVNHKSDSYQTLEDKPKTGTGTSTASKGMFTDGTGFFFTDDQEVINLTATQGATVTLYAVWKRDACIITFNANAPRNTSQVTGTMQDQVVDRNTSPSLTSCGFTLPGWTFIGWTTGDYRTVTQDETLNGWNNITAANSKWTNGQAIDAEVTNPRAGLVLYAMWKSITYSVRYQPNGAPGATFVKDTRTFAYDPVADYTLLKNTWEFLDKRFVGWSKSASGDAIYSDESTFRNLTTTAGETVDLYAVWRNLDYAADLRSLLYSVADWAFEDYSCYAFAAFAQYRIECAGMFGLVLNNGEYGHWIEAADPEEGMEWEAVELNDVVYEGIDPTAAKVHYKEFEIRIKRVVRTRELHDALYVGHLGESGYDFPKFEDVSGVGFTAQSWKGFTDAFQSGVNWLAWAQDSRFVVNQNDVQGAVLDYELMYLGLEADKIFLAELLSRAMLYPSPGLFTNITDTFMDALYAAYDISENENAQVFGPTSPTILATLELLSEISKLRVDTTRAVREIEIPIAYEDLLRGENGATYGYEEYLEGIEDLKAFIKYTAEVVEDPEWYEYFSLEDFEAKLVEFYDIKSRVLLTTIDSLQQYINQFVGVGEQFTDESWAVFSAILLESQDFCNENPTATPNQIRTQFSKLVYAATILVPKTPPAPPEDPFPIAILIGAICGGIGLVVLVIVGSTIAVKKRARKSDKLVEYEKEKARLKANADAKIETAKGGFGAAVMSVRAAKTAPNDAGVRNKAMQELTQVGTNIGEAQGAVNELSNFKKSHARLEKLSIARAELASRKGV
jgi:hypothetical protein